MVVVPWLLTRNKKERIMSADTEGNMNRYVGLTYPRFLDFGFIHRLWKRFLCPKQIHLFDECDALSHTLNCDACGLRVHIALIETSEKVCERVKKLKYIKTTATEEPD